jgi:glucose-6-phosphate dehydrogenase assembly protein OpcA
MAQTVNRASTVDASLDAINAAMSRTSGSTSTLNLIVWIDDPGRRDWILLRAGLLADKHPSFTLILDNTGQRSGDATISATVRDDRPQTTAQGQRVDIDVAGSDAATIERYANNLCANGVPTVLWWSGANVVASRPIFEALLPHADLLLVDSSGALRDESGISRLVAFHQQHREVVLRDLAWMRLGPWRDMIAAFFDDPELRPELFSIRRLYIASGSASEALYLGGWLASRLGWTATGRDAFADRCGKPVTFVREREGDIRRVQSICLDSETSWYHGRVTDDPRVVRVWSEGMNVAGPRLFPLRAIDNASLLERAVLEPGTDDLFEQALQMLEKLLN